MMPTHQVSFFPHLFSALTTTALPLPPASTTTAAPLSPSPTSLLTITAIPPPASTTVATTSPQTSSAWEEQKEMDALRKVYHRAEQNYGLCILLFIAINYSHLCRLKKTCLICLRHICKLEQSSAWEENNLTGACSSSRLDADTC